MKIKIEVEDDREALAIKTALDNKETRALVLTMGHLLRLRSDKARARVLNFVADALEEEEAIQAKEP
jgi:hypothetical protein